MNEPAELRRFYTHLVETRRKERHGVSPGAARAHFLGPSSVLVADYDGRVGNNTTRGVSHQPDQSAGGSGGVHGKGEDSRGDNCRTDAAKPRHSPYFHQAL